MNLTGIAVCAAFGAALLPAPSAWAGSIHCVVVDAETDEPIPTFILRASAAKENEPAYWQSHIRLTGEKGGITWTRESGWDNARVRIEAPGYMPAVSTYIVKKDENETSLRFALVRSDGFTGTVVGADGKAVAGAQVALATCTNDASIRGISLTVPDKKFSVVTDAAGRFHLPPECDPFTILVVHNDGYAQVSSDEFSKSVFGK